jgi:pyruvate/2-oxoglutarate/acetoin dehydrogenase E1 component
MSQHPINVVFERAMDEQPELTYLATTRVAGWERTYGADRSVCMPISENAMMGIGVGLAMTGRRTVVDLARAAFLFTAMDPLVNQATKWRYLSDGQYSVPLLVLAITRCGENSGSQHEHVPHSMLCQVPGLVVAVPSSVNSAAGLMATALNHPDPVVIHETSRIFFPGWDTATDIEPTFDPIPFGLAHRVREGTDVTLVGIGNTVTDCLTAADQLAQRGISAQVVDLRTAAPLDRDGVALLASTTRAAVLVDEAIGACSLMNDLGLHLLTSGAVEPVGLRVVASDPCPIPASPTLQAVVLPSAADVAEAAADALDGRPAR